MKMRKLFTLLVAFICGTMASAQTGAISVNSVTIAKGGTSQMEVTINNAKENTAFQFDLSLPTGITVKSVGLNGEYPETRITLNDDVDGKARFLSYDEENANLNDDTKVMITLEAAADATIGDVAVVGSEVWVVKEYNDIIDASTQGDGNVAIITITDGSDTTGISRIAVEAAGNDLWYNLSGQRICAPTKKGLYIRNGKKIVLK